MRGTRPCFEAHREFLFSLRLGRQTLHCGDARWSIWPGQLHQWFFRRKRQADHNDATYNSKRLGRVHSTLLLYSSDSRCYFEHLYHPSDDDYVDKLYTNAEPETGRRYRLGNLLASGTSAASNGKPEYEFLGVTGRWRFSKDDMQRLYAQGRIDQRSLGAEPHFKQYLDEVAGVPVGFTWDDIPALQSYSAERLGDFTQEPLNLLEKIIGIALQASGGDRDAPGGCSTALVAALDENSSGSELDTSPTFAASPRVRL